MTPPERALLLGMKAASTMSVETSAYARPSDEGPMARMKRNAMRRPSPDLMSARDRKKAQSTSQTMGSAKPARASRGVMTLNSAMAQTPRKTTAPGAMGRAMGPQ